MNLEKNFIQEIRIVKSKIPEKSYLRKIAAIQMIDKLVFSSKITILTGENGSGKSTLLEGIAAAYGLNVEGGTRNFLYSPSVELAKAISLYRGICRPQDEFFFRAESFYNVITKIDDYEKTQAGYLRYYGGKSLHKLSHGESFMALVQNRFSSNSLYILDEPEAALSPQRQLAILRIIYKLAQENTQFIIATNSPIFVSIPNAEVLSLSERGIEKISFEETECFQVMSMFIKYRERLLYDLLQK